MNGLSLHFLYAVAVAFAFSIGSVLASTEVDLEEELKSLSIPENEVPLLASEEKLYAVQNRFAPLRYRHELSIGGSRNVTAENFLLSHTVTGGYRFHLNDRWNLGVSGSYVFNELSKNAYRLIQEERVYPDVTYARFMADATVAFNVFYGKLRMTMERVIYFDVYVGLGPGIVDSNRGLEWAAVGDVGFSVWFGRMGFVRLGIKDYFHQEQHRQSTSLTHDILGHLNLGVLLGGGGDS